MSATELLTAVVIVTALVTLLLLGAGLLGRRVGSPRPPGAESEASEDSWYFVRFLPDGRDLDRG